MISCKVPRIPHYNQTVPNYILGNLTLPDDDLINIKYIDLYCLSYVLLTELSKLHSKDYSVH